MKTILLSLALLTFAGCAQLRQVEIRADASEQLAGDFQYHYGNEQYGGGLVGRIEVAAPLYEQGGFRVFGSVTHESLLNTGRDRGEERAHLGVVWRPFSP